MNDQNGTIKNVRGKKTHYSLLIFVSHNYVLLSINQHNENIIHYFILNLVESLNAF